MGERKRPLCPDSIRLHAPGTATYSSLCSGWEWKSEPNFGVDQVLSFARGAANADCEQRLISCEADDELWIGGVVEG